MARSTRFVLEGQKGVSRHNFNFNGINIDSAVVVTAAEIADFVGAIAGFKTVGRPHLGAASVWVSNVGPHGGPGGEAGGVEFLLHVDSPGPLRIVVTISALENIEAFAQ